MIINLLLPIFMYQKIVTSVDFGPAIWISRTGNYYQASSEIYFSVVWNFVEVNYSYINFPRRKITNDQLLTHHLGITLLKDIWQDDKNIFGIGIGPSYWIITHRYNKAYERAGVIGLKYGVYSEHYLSQDRKWLFAVKFKIDELIEYRILNSLLTIHPQFLLTTTLGIKLIIK
ncbi:MAG: hypothetical protein NZ601_04370 [candidate division WOR-3 bacterium]|nr:hypothetical protein [candidate division WOR-3 bacterium]MCX7757579.1 hypothetical protein [candidate division WOR-3 bacterium]MDW7987529.1 hypothetical protein [candidate division WOR-3 bacterium]